MPKITKNTTKYSFFNSRIQTFNSLNGFKGIFLEKVSKNLVLDQRLPDPRIAISVRCIDGCVVVNVVVVPATTTVIEPFPGMRSTL